MDKWEKVVALHRILHAHRYCVPLKSILEKLECSEATFHRIRSFLKNRLNAPLVFDGKYSGYRYDECNGERFELPGLWFTKDEIEALLLFEQAVDSLHEGLFAGLLDPLREYLDNAYKAQNIRPAAMRDRIKILKIGSRTIEPPLFRTIATAVLHEKRLEIMHQALAGAAPKRRTVSPLALIRYRDNWYLDAFCHLRNSLRTFALNRITQVRPAPGRLHKVDENKRKQFYEEAYGIFTGPAKNVAEIHFSGAAASEVSREQLHPRQRGEWLANGVYRLFVPYGKSRELIMDILRWGEGARVAGPEKLKKEVKMALQKALKKYAK